MTRTYDAQWVEQFYDEYGEKEWHRLVRDVHNEAKLHVHRHYLERHVRPGSYVLEVGAGPGRFTRMLAEMGCSVVVADISPVQLNLNRRYAAELGFEHAVEQWLLGVLDVPPDENAKITASGDIAPHTYAASKHHCHMFRAAELRRLLEGCGAELAEMSAAACLTTVWGERLSEARQDPARWRELLRMEVEACREPGCLDMGTHLIAVARKPQGRTAPGSEEAVP